MINLSNQLQLRNGGSGSRPIPRPLRFALCALRLVVPAEAESRLSERLREDSRQRFVRTRERLLHHRHLHPLDFHFLIPVLTRTRRDEVADDDVLLETQQVVLRATNGRVGQHPRRLLERRRRNEALRRQARLRDA